VDAEKPSKRLGDTALHLVMVRFLALARFRRTIELTLNPTPEEAESTRYVVTTVYVRHDLHRFLALFSNRRHREGFNGD